MKFEEWAEATGIEPGRLKRILSRSIAAGDVERVGDELRLTAQGQRISRRHKYSKTLTFDEILKDAVVIRAWLHREAYAVRYELAKQGMLALPPNQLEVLRVTYEKSRKFITVEDVKKALPQLKVANAKIARTLIVLGATRQQSGENVSYLVPPQLIFRELRDLTRTKKEHLQEGREREDAMREMIRAQRSSQGGGE